MTEHNWKPGDVAMVTIPGRGETVAMYMDGGDWETSWAEPDGQTTYAAAPTYGNGLPGRPLVVIDPEDREQVERLLRAWYERDYSSQALLDKIPRMQAALREFAAPTPPKPDEPRGLGAVVEDVNDVAWVQFYSKTGKWWRNGQGVTRRWSDLTAVRVLSEGVA